MNGETVVGIAVVGIVVWLLLRQSSQPSAQLQTATQGGPALPLNIPSIQIPTMVSPPDLKGFVSPFIQTTNKTIINNTQVAGANPCSCACDSGAGDINNLINGTISGLADSFNKLGTKALSDYTTNVLSAIPDYVKQFMENPQADAAASIENAKAVDFLRPTPIFYATGVGGIGTSGKAFSGGNAGDYYIDFLRGKDAKLGPGIYNFAKRPMINIGPTYSPA